MLSLQIKIIALLYFSWSAREYSAVACPTILQLGDEGSRPVVQDELSEAAAHFSKVAEATESVATTKPTRSASIMRNWEKNEEIIKAMVNEAKCNLHKTEKLSSSQQNGPPLEALQRLRSCSRQVCQGAKQKAFHLRFRLLSGPAEPKEPDQNPHGMESFDKGRTKTGLRGSTSQMMQSFQRLRSFQGSSQYDGKEVTSKTLQRTKSLDQPSRWLPLELHSPKNGLYGRSFERNSERGKFVFDPALFGDEITKSLKDCLLAVLPAHKPPRYEIVDSQKKFLTAVFGAVNFLYKYNFINRENMNLFFTSEPHTLSLTGQHIATTFHLVHDNPKFIPLIDIQSLVNSKETEHIQNCLNGMDAQTQKWIIHFTFSSIFKKFVVFIQWEYIPTYLRKIINNVTQGAFVEHIIDRKGKGLESMHIKDLETVTLLIKNFENPIKKDTKECEKDQLSRVKEIFRLNFSLLSHIIQNFCDEQDLKVISSYVDSYGQFKSKLQLFITGYKILSLHERWSNYAHKNKFLGLSIFQHNDKNAEKFKIKENLEILKFQNYKLTKEVEKAESGLQWKNCPIIMASLKKYSRLLEFMCKYLKEDFEIA